MDFEPGLPSAWWNLRGQRAAERRTADQIQPSAAPRHAGANDDAERLAMLGEAYLDLFGPHSAARKFSYWWRWAFERLGSRAAAAEDTPGDAYSAI